MTRLAASPASSLIWKALTAVRSLTLCQAPRVFFAKCTFQYRQHAGHDLGVAVAQQMDDRAPPDFLHSLLFKEEAAPDAVHNVQTTTGDGDMDGRGLIELAAIGMQGAEDADLDAQLARVPEQGAGGAAEQVIEQWPVVAEERSEQVWHGKSDVLPFAVGQDVLLLSNPLQAFDLMVRRLNRLF